MNRVNKEIEEYVESEIIPRYASFDRAHREDHVRTVIEQSMALAQTMERLDLDMVYVVAAFHDLGLVNGRERHHIDSGRILAADAFVRARFTPEQIAVMAEAVEDHRASGKTRPRSDYGLVVAEADRCIDAATIVRRTVQYGLANYPELDREGHFGRTMQHLNEKYGPGGYLKIWIPGSENERRLKELHALMADGERLRTMFDEVFDCETHQL